MNEWIDSEIQYATGPDMLDPQQVANEFHDSLDEDDAPVPPVAPASVSPAAAAAPVVAFGAPAAAVAPPPVVAVGAPAAAVGAPFVSPKKAKINK